MSDLGNVERVCYRQEVVFDWKIDDFSSLRDDYDLLICSPDFYFYGYPWYLALYPNRTAAEQSERYIGLYLCLHSVRSVLDIGFSLGVRTADGETEVWCEKISTFSNGMCLHGTDRSIKKSELFRRRDELLPSDVLTLRVTLNVVDGMALKKGFKNASSVQAATERSFEDASVQAAAESSFVDASVQAAVEHDAASDETKEPSPKTGSEKIVEDIGKLWLSGGNCDVLLKVGDVEFKAHRTILAARTPVLCAMFNHDTVEKSSGEVTIDDCEPSVFEQFLHYIYTGAPHELNAENASALYVVADKYLVSEVKELCVRCMLDNLCLDSFCNTVKLALMHREDELLKVAINFLSKNMLRVMKTVEWQRFMFESATWANEIQIRAMELIEEKLTAVDPSQA